MSLWSRIFRPKSELPAFEHPVLGKIEATIDNKDGSYFWETPAPLVTQRGRIGIFFDAPDTGPSEQQIELWHFIYDDFEFFAEAAKPLLLETLADFRREHELPQLSWCSVGLSKDGLRESMWDLGFEAPDGCILTVYFEHGEPTTVSYDD